jgi:two-component system cell cycle sensor histidine kinase/response regulator CckA
MAKQTTPLSSIVKDSIVIAVIIVTLLVLAIPFRFFDLLFSFIIQYRRYYTEEIVLVLLVLSVLFAMFSLRRWRELKHEIAERTRSERAQWESETRFREVVESLNEGLILTDLEDRIIYINHRMTELCGWTMNELIGNPAKEFFIPKNKWEEHAARIVRRKNGSAERYELQLLRKNGTMFWAEIYGSAYRDAAANVIGTIGIITDITEMRWNERLQSALYRINAVNLSANDIQQMFAQLHGIISELMYARNFYIALYDPATTMISFPYFVDEYDPPPPPRPFSHGSTEYILTTGEILHAPMEVFDTLSGRGDVELIGAQAVDWLGVPLKYGGKTFGVLAIQSYDPKIMFSEKEKEILVFVSEHISSAIRQRWDEERFRIVWEGSTEGMRVTDKDGNIVMVNEAYCALVKKKKEDLLGRSFHYAYRNEDDDIRPHVEIYKERFKNNTIPRWVETQISLWNNESIAIEMTTSYITLGSNERMLLSIFRDVTERKKLEDQLLHAQKMDSIGILAGGIAHDFNNVLAMILGSAELIKHKAKDLPEVIKFAQMIANAAERGSGIAKQLLMFARAEKGLLRPLSLSMIVQDVCKLLEHTIPKSIALKTTAKADNDVILGDEDQLHQVIINLSVNARDAIVHKGPDGGVLAFEIDTVHGRELKKKYPRITDDLFVSLRVTDNGIGMSEETLRHIFEPFYTTKERGKGTGLGLSIVHGIVKNHNGVVDVESAPGKGTTFTLYFPATMVVDQQKAPIVSEQTAATATSPRSGVILVVDDEDNLRVMLKDILESDGYSIITACDGEEAKQVFERRRNEISLIVSDLGMPLCDGVQLLRHIKATAPTIPFVISTGYTNRESQEEILAGGADGILLKPFKVEQILEFAHRFARRM